MSGRPTAEDVKSEKGEKTAPSVKSLKSAKDKRFDELEATVRQIENGAKINDWSLIYTGEFARRAWGGVVICYEAVTNNGIYRVRQVESPDSDPYQAE